MSEAALFSDSPGSTPELAAVPTPPAIQAENVSASYRIRRESRSVLTDLRNLAHRVTGKSDGEAIVPALRGVSFEVKRGSTLAVIGRNGAGKSTLLRVIAGILLPEEGRVVVRGRLNLLAVGIGFNPVLSGRENIVLGGLASGFTPDQLDDLTDEIAEFAQLGDYLDFPMRTYSGGMKARLGFAVAAHLDPEILLIDEALAGGDTAFGERVGEKMAQLCGEGRTIVLVTHGLSSVRTMANEAMWLHQGQVSAIGDPEEVVAKYMRYCRLESMDFDLDS